MFGAAGGHGPELWPDATRKKPDSGKDEANLEK